MRMESVAEQRKDGSQNAKQTSKQQGKGEALLMFLRRLSFFFDRDTVSGFVNFCSTE